MTDKEKDTQLQEEELEQQTAESVEEETATNEEQPEGEDQLQKDYQELKDKYLRLYAEFDNYKKRTLKEKVDLMKTAAEDTIKALLPVLDDFDRAKKTADDDSTEEVFSEGVALVYNKLHSILKNKGLAIMESDGETFDPEFHEALTEIPAPTEELKGKVIDTVEKGYLLNDKIIRYAKVVTGK